MNSEIEPGRRLASLITLVGAVLMLSTASRWQWLTAMWYPAGWSMGWLGLAGAVVTAIGSLLYLKYREPPFSR